MPRVKPVAPPSGGIAGTEASRMAAPVPPRSPDATPSRFQSFVERFVIERCGYWPKPNEGDVLQAAWDEILFARSVYNMIGNLDNVERKRNGKVPKAAP